MASRDGLKKWKVFLSRTIFLSTMFFVFPCVGVYLDEFISEFHISLPLASWALTLMAGLAFLVGPFIVGVYKYFSYRHVSVISGFLFGLLFIALGAVLRNTTHVFVCSILSGIALGAVGLSTYLQLGETFRSKFGMANTASYLVASLWTIGIPLLVEYWKVEYGLRWTLILTGAFTWHLVLAGFCLTTNESTAPLKESLPEETETLHSSFFLRYHPYLVCHFIFQTTAFTRIFGLPLLLYPFAISKELNHTQAALLTSMFTLGAMIGRLNAFCTFVCKVMELPLAMATFIITAPVWIAMIIQIISINSASEVVLVVMAITAGLSIGFETCWGISSAMDFSCKEHFKAVASWVLFFSGTGATFGGLIVGLTYNIRRSYDDVMALMVILSGLQGALAAITLTWKRFSRADAKL